MYYSFEMMLVGIILFSAMIGGGVYMYYKRKTTSLENSNSFPENSSANDKETSNG